MRTGALMLAMSMPCFAKYGAPSRPLTSFRVIVLPMAPRPAMPTLIGFISRRLQRFLFRRRRKRTVELGKILRAQFQIQRRLILAHMRFPSGLGNGENALLSDGPGERHLCRCGAVPVRDQPKLLRTQ